MVAQAATAAVDPAGFLYALCHDEFGMTDAGSFNSIVHRLHFCFVGLLGKDLLYAQQEKKDKQYPFHAYVLNSSGRFINRMFERCRIYKNHTQIKVSRDKTIARGPSPAQLFTFAKNSY